MSRIEAEHQTTNEHEFRRIKKAETICKKLVFIGAYSWLMLPESCLDPCYPCDPWLSLLRASEAMIFSKHGSPYIGANPGIITTTLPDMGLVR